MNFGKVLGVTLICFMLPAIASAQAATLVSSPTDENVRQIVDTRFTQLTRGINLSHWFSQTSSFNPTYITVEDFEIIQEAGFNHVRLTLDPSLLFDENNPESLNGEYLGYLDNALNQIQASNLSAVVTLYADDPFKQRLATDDAFVTSVAGFWHALAGHLSTRNPAQIFLETLNEPAFNYFLRDEPSIDPAQRWSQVQERLLASMRQAAPNHTLIATGDKWSGIDGLLDLTPVADRNVVYNFHFYDPMVFTHQGATWIAPGFESLQNLPYPFNAEACAAVLSTIDEIARGWAQDYCDRQWDVTKLEARIAQAAAWAQQHNVRLTANEFGVYQVAVRPEDRMAWIEDVRSLLEKYQIGWAMWNYSEGFAAVRRQDGKRAIDPAVAQALGLSVNYSGDPSSPTPIYENPPQSRHIPEPSAIAGLALVALVAVGIPKRR